MWRWLTAGPDPGAWVVPEKIWACPYPHMEDALAALAAKNIRFVVNLHVKAHGEGIARFCLVERHFPTPDFCAPTPDALDAIAALATQEIQEGRAIAIHCGGGLGRTGTAVACCLLRLCPELDVAEAIAQARSARPGSIETRSQERAIHDFAVRRGSRR